MPNIKYINTNMPPWNGVDQNGTTYQWLIGYVPQEYVIDGDTLWIKPVVKSPNFHSNHTHYETINTGNPQNPTANIEVIKCRLVGINAWETHKGQYTNQIDPEKDNNPADGTNSAVSRNKPILSDHYLPDTPEWDEKALEMGDEGKEAMKQIISSHGGYVFAQIDTWDSKYDDGPGHDAYGRHIAKVYVFDKPNDLQYHSLIDNAEDSAMYYDIANKDRSVLLLATWRLTQRYWRNANEIPAIDTFSTLMLDRVSSSLTPSPSCTTYTSAQEANVANVGSMIVTKDTTYFKTIYGDTFDNAYSSFANDYDMFLTALEVDMNPLYEICSFAITGEQYYYLTDKVARYAYGYMVSNPNARYNGVLFTADVSDVPPEADWDAILQNLKFTVSSTAFSNPEITTPAEYWIQNAKQWCLDKKSSPPLTLRNEVPCVNFTMVATHSDKYPALGLAHIDYAFKRDTNSRTSIDQYSGASVASSYPVLSWLKYEDDLIDAASQDFEDNEFNKRFKELYDSFLGQPNAKKYMDKDGNIWQTTGNLKDTTDVNNMLSYDLVKLDKYGEPVMIPDGNGKLVPELYSPPNYVYSNLNPVPVSFNLLNNDALDNDFSLRIGDVQFVVPPLAINITETSKATRMQNLRTKSSIQISSGYSDITITVQLFFHNIESINGFEVENPFQTAYKNLTVNGGSNPNRGSIPDNLNILCKQWKDPYAINGLRALISQFKKAPFLPVYNELIVDQYGVHTVALQGLTINTVPNFPNVLSATLTLVPFNHEPYIPDIPEIGQRFNWPLFRWYTQGCLQEQADPMRTYLKPIKDANGKERMRYRIKFKLADENQLKNQAALTKKFRDMYNPATVLDNNSASEFYDWDDQQLANATGQKERFATWRANLERSEESGLIADLSDSCKFKPKLSKLMALCRGKTFLKLRILNSIDTFSLGLDTGIRGDPDFAPYAISDTLEDLRALSAWLEYVLRQYIDDDETYVTAIRNMRALSHDGAFEILKENAKAMDVVSSFICTAVWNIFEVLSIPNERISDWFMSDEQLDQKHRPFYNYFLLAAISELMIQNAKAYTYAGEEPVYILNYYDYTLLRQPNYFLLILVGMIAAATLQPELAFGVVAAYGVTIVCNNVSNIYQNYVDARNYIDASQEGIFCAKLQSQKLLQELITISKDKDGNVTVINGTPTFIDKVGEAINRLFTGTMNVLGTQVIFKEEAIPELRKIIKSDVGSYMYYEQYYMNMASKIRLSEENLNLVDYEMDYEDLIVQGISCEMNNVYSSLQLADQENPTMQYFGAQDSVYTIHAQTKNRDIVDQLKTLFSECQRISRSYRMEINSGIIGLENDVINLCGTNCIIPVGLDISTVEGQPELINIRINVVSFDKTQKRGETPNQIQLHQEGDFLYREDWLAYIDKKSKNEESQMMAFEQKLKQMEVYPDMELPTWYELSAALPYLSCGVDSIQELNALYGKLGPNRGKFVDPDFYINCDKTLRSEIWNWMEKGKRPPIMLAGIANDKALLNYADDIAALPAIYEKNTEATTIENNTLIVERSIRALASPKADNYYTTGYGTGTSSDNSGSGSDSGDSDSSTGGGVTITENTNVTLIGGMPKVNTGVVKSYGNMGDAKNKQCSIEYTYKIPTLEQVLEWYYSGVTQAIKDDITDKYNHGKYTEIFKNPTKDEIYAECLKNVKEMFKYDDGVTPPQDTPYKTKITFDGKTYEVITPTTIGYEKLARAMMMTFSVESGYAQFEYGKSIVVNGKTLVAKVDVAPHYARTQVRSSNAIGLGQLTSGCGSISDPASFYRAAWDWRWNIKLSCYRFAWCVKYGTSDAYNVTIKDSAGNKLDLRCFILEMACQYYKQRIKPSEFLPQKRWNSAVTNYKKLCAELGTKGSSKDSSDNSGSDDSGSKTKAADTTTATKYGLQGTPDQADYDVDQFVMAGEFYYMTLSYIKALDHHKQDIGKTNLQYKEKKYDYIDPKDPEGANAHIDTDGTYSSQTSDYNIRYTMWTPVGITDSKGNFSATEEYKNSYGAPVGDRWADMFSKIEKIAEVTCNTTSEEDHDFIVKWVKDNEIPRVRTMFDTYFPRFEAEQKYWDFMTNSNTGVLYWLQNTAKYTSYMCVWGLRDFFNHQFWKQAGNASKDNFMYALRRLTARISAEAQKQLLAHRDLKPWNFVIKLTTEPYKYKDKDGNEKTTPGVSISDTLDMAIDHVTILPDLVLYDELKGVSVESITSWFQKTEQEELLDSSNKMLVDFMATSMHGRLVRAFPTFQMFIIDEGEWKMFYKMWDNLYGFNSIQAIDIIKDKRMAADTALITMTNLYANLTTKDNLNRPGDWEFSFVNAIFKGEWTKAWSVILNAPDRAIFESRKEVMDSLMLKAGARVHLRMGYGSNAEALPILINGTVTEISPPGEQIQIVVQGDGLELTNRIPAKKGQTNDSSWFTLPHDPVLTILETITWSGSWIETIVQKALETFGVRGNAMGVEHFGMTNTIPDDLLAPHLFRYSAHRKQYGELALNVHDLTGKDMESAWVLSTTPYTQEAEDYQSPWGRRVYLVEKPAGSDRDRPKVYLYDKSVWDLCNILATCLPDFVCSVVPFGLRSTLFFGRPYYSLAYDYDYMYTRDPTLKKLTAVPVHIYRKSFEQYHLITSPTDIISNKLLASSTNVFTNVIVSYGGQNGDKACQSPTVQMDSDIYAVDQKTANHYLDLAPSSLTEGWGDFWCSQNIARAAATNILKTYAGNMYDGEILVLGSPGIKPHDTIGIKDFYNDMSGYVGVRRVTHHMSLETGFTTSINPSCLSVGDDNKLLVWRTWAIGILTHAVGSPLVRLLACRLMNNFVGVLIGRALLTGNAKKIAKAESKILYKLTTNMFGKSETANQIRGVLDKTLKAKMFPGFGYRHPIQDTINGIKALNISAANTASGRQVNVFVEYLKALDELANPSTNLNFMQEAIRKLSTRNILLTGNVTAHTLDDLIDIEETLKFVMANRKDLGSSLKIATDAEIRKAMDIVSDAKKNFDAAGKVITTDAKVIKSMEDVGDGIKDVVTGLNKTDKVGDVARALRQVQKVKKLGTIIGSADKLLDIAKVFSIGGGLPGIVIETAIEVALQILVSYVAECYLRMRHDRQAIQILPIKFRGKILTAGIRGHRGAVIGDVPSYWDDIFENKLDWLNKLLAPDEDYKVTPDPREWLNGMDELEADDYIDYSTADE